MLVEAHSFKSAIERELVKISRDPFFDNLNEAYFDYTRELVDSNWSKHQFVSVENGYNIVGYLEAGINRTVRYVDNLVLINFKKAWNSTFSIDLKEFIFLLFFRYNYNKINFSVNTNTRNEKIYDKFINRYGGRIVGTFIRHRMLQNGNIVDNKYYEITKEDFESKVKLLHLKEFERFMQKIK